MSGQEVSPSGAYDPLYPEPVENVYHRRKMFEFRERYEPIFARLPEPVKREAMAAIKAIAKRNRLTYMAALNDDFLDDIPENPVVTHESRNQIRCRLNSTNIPDASPASPSPATSEGMDDPSGSAHSDSDGSGNSKRKIETRSSKKSLGGLAEPTTRSAANRTPIQNQKKRSAIPEPSVSTRKKRQRGPGAAAHHPSTTQRGEDATASVGDQGSQENDVVKLKVKLRKAEAVNDHLEAKVIGEGQEIMALKEREKSTGENLDHIREENAKLQTQLKTAEEERNGAQEEFNRLNDLVRARLEESRRAIGEAIQGTHGLSLVVDGIKSVLPPRQNDT
ncbi:transmembrane protein domain-containing protein [Purpureocillium lilacinum]|uniref:Transmembrane protein domain-containing protein n=1 Tax=Purpureocillium lilacinum TaxID=33203 RepID=A0A179H1A8_PURLI|nr:transmembrane protein domain-containing protein [Purpureocillium lilacinum]OAQ83261.1 transmembrane protein domain-containing protein [Purpureocillium lilacinum]